MHWKMRQNNFANFAFSTLLGNVRFLWNLKVIPPCEAVPFCKCLSLSGSNKLRLYYKPMLYRSTTSLAIAPLSYLYLLPLPPHCAPWLTHHLYMQVTNRDRVCYRQRQRVLQGPVLGRPSLGTDTMRCDVAVRTPCSSFSTGRGIARSSPGYDPGFRVFCWWWRCASFVSRVGNITGTNMGTPRCCTEEDLKDGVSSVTSSGSDRRRITSSLPREKVSFWGRVTS